MKGSKPIIGLLALVVAALAAVAGWKSWRWLTEQGEPALAPGNGRQAPAVPPSTAGETSPPVVPQGSVEPTTVETASPVAAVAEPAAIAEDEASGLRDAGAEPETAEELADLLPEPDLPLTGVVAGVESDAAESGGAEAEASVDTVLEVLAAQEEAREPATIQSRFGPHAAPPDEDGDCPEEYPVKGNTNSMIYHLPGQASYGATRSEVCFASAEAAQEAGFRPRKR